MLGLVIEAHCSVMCNESAHLRMSDFPIKSEEMESDAYVIFPKKAS